MVKPRFAAPNLLAAILTVGLLVDAILRNEAYPDSLRVGRPRHRRVTLVARADAGYPGPVRALAYNRP
jgi:hypothetical protein